MVVILKQNQGKGLKFSLSTLAIALVITIFLFTSIVTISLVDSDSFVNAAGSITIDNSTSGGIKGAINNGNDTVNLEQGNYSTNNVNIDIKNNRNVTVNGKGSANQVVVDASKQGRFFKVDSGSSLTLTNITFINGEQIDVAYFGGAIYNNGGKLIVMDCIFINNHAQTSGGAIANDLNGFVNITNSNFSENNAVYGGALVNRFETDGNLLFVNECVFTNNKANFGGAILNDNYLSCTVSNSIFRANNGSANGGGIMNYGYFKLISSNFTSNLATIEGGAIANFMLDFTIINSSFINNSASNRGGAISNALYSDYACNLFINNSIFSKNRLSFSSSGGAGIYNGLYNESIRLVKTNVVLFNSSFENHSSNRGGVIYNNGSLANFNMSSCSFNNNSASVGGGVIYNYDGTLNLIASNFSNSSSNSSGGVIYNNGSDTHLNINNCIFEISKASNYGGIIYNINNSATRINSTNNKTYLYSNTSFMISNSMFIGGSVVDDRSGYGGAIYNVGANISIISTQFISNSAITYGGAIYNTGYNLTISGCTFIDNFVKNGTSSINTNSGGAIYSSTSLSNGTESLKIINSIFLKNVATGYNGGAVCITNGTLSVFGSRFTENSAGYGGAIYGSSSSIVDINNSVFIGNYPNNGMGGSAIYNDGKCNVINSNFSFNKDGYGGTICNNGIFYLADSNFNNNSAVMYGGAIYNKGSSFTILRSNFTNNFASTSGGAIENWGEILIINQSNFINNCIFEISKDSKYGGIIYNINN